MLRAADGMSYVATGVLPAGANPSTESAAVLDPNRFAAMALRHELLAAVHGRPIQIATPRVRWSDGNKSIECKG